MIHTDTLLQLYQNVNTAAYLKLRQNINNIQNPVLPNNWHESTTCFMYICCINKGFTMKYECVLCHIYFYCHSLAVKVTMTIISIDFFFYSYSYSYCKKHVWVRLWSYWTYLKVCPSGCVRCWLGIEEAQ